MGGKICRCGAILFVGILALSGCAGPQPSSTLKATPGARPESASVRQRVTDLTNDRRAANVKRDRRLERAAQSYAEMLARSGKFSHEADGRDCGQRAIAAGFDARVVCENLYWCEVPGGITSDDLAIAAGGGWMKSAGHRRNLLAARGLVVGIGVGPGAEAGG